VNGAAPPTPDGWAGLSRPVYLEHLEKENSFLREQNTVLLERVKETNILTAGLQNYSARCLAVRANEEAILITMRPRPSEVFPSSSTLLFR